MYGFKKELVSLTGKNLKRVQQELKISIQQIDDALTVLDPTRHAAAKICLCESREILKNALAEIRRKLVV